MIQLGLVGCGRLAEFGYAPALGGLRGVEVVAVADSDAGRAEALARRLGPDVTAHESAGALIAAAAPDGLVVSTPPAAHLGAAEAAAAAGLPCLIEKPPADTLEAAVAIAALDPAPWIGFNRRFQHAARIGRVTGGPCELELEIRYRRASWRPHTVDDDALLDLAPHLVDLALFLSGESQATVRSAILSRERVALELGLGESRATIRCATDRAYYERVDVRVGGERVGQSGDGGPANALLTRLPWVEYPLVASLRAQLAAFADALEGRDPGLLAGAEDGVRVMRVIESVRVAA